MWEVLVADELGKRGTGGRLRTGVEGVCKVGCVVSVGSTRACVGDGGRLTFV